MYSVKTITKTRSPINETTKAKDRQRQATYRAEKRYGSTTELSKRSQHMKRVRALMLLGGKCEKCDNNDMRTLHIDQTTGRHTAEKQIVMLSVGSLRLLNDFKSSVPIITK